MASGDIYTIDVQADSSNGNSVAVTLKVDSLLLNIDVYAYNGNDDANHDFYISYSTDNGKIILIKGVVPNFIGASVVLPNQRFKTMLRANDNIYVSISNSNNYQNIYVRARLTLMEL